MTAVSPRDLADALESLDPSEYHVACMPDFFLDHFVTLPNWNAIVPRMQRIHDQGGGNLPGLPQHVQSGGNAANTARALARLGVHAHLVCRTSPFGAMYLRESLGRAGVDLSHVRDDGRLATTMALEFTDGHHRNVMLNDSGSVADFGPEQLSDDDWTLVEGADLVLVTNWTQNLRGNDLARDVFRRARAKGTFTFLDTGDPSPRLDDVPGFLKDLFESADVDAVGVNENEVRHFRNALGENPEEDPVASARALARHRPGRLDLHTAEHAASWGEGASDETAIATFPVSPLRATGAGDSWNAGNVLGYLAGLAPADRLALANAVAGLYVSGESGLHPTLGEVVDFVRAQDPV